jgi:signal transduction histidine kinase
MTENSEHLDDYNVNVRTVTFLVVMIVIVLTLVYFIRIYSDQKAEVLNDMKIEATILQTVIQDHINYSKYFISIIAADIQNYHEDLKYIETILADRFQSQDFNVLFGWRKFSWVDKDFNEIVTSTYGINHRPRPLAFMRDIMSEIKVNQPNWKDNIVFHTNKDIQNGDSVKMIDSLVDDKTGSYIGSVILTYDIETMVRSLSTRKQNPNTNFIIIDKNLEVIAQSKPFVDKITNAKGELSRELKNILNKTDFLSEDSLDYSYLGMMDGVNFYIKPANPSLPFIIIINIDNNVIRGNILESLTKKFVEVSIFAIICLFMVISIYKRETMLRSKAEQATKEANKATKAKTDFLAFTAHEVRSPLGFILTGSEIMTKELMGQMPEAYMKYAEGIHQNGQIILQFITDILDENQIIEGKFKIVNSFTDIKLIIREAIKVNRARYNDRKVRIRAIYPDKIIPLVICDKGRMLQVLSNLISNGIKYSNDGTKLTVITMMNGENLEIHVKDEGFGMSKDDIKIALSTYGSVQKSNYHVGSYGLGLPIVKMLLDAHEAELKIESKDGEGTVVKIIFPKYKLVYNAIKNSN